MTPTDVDQEPIVGQRPALARTRRWGGARWRMYARMVSSSVLRRRSRVLVAVAAVMIGATTLSGLVTVYRDIPQQLAREFRGYGANLIVVPAAGSTVLSTSVMGEIEALLPGDDVVGFAPYRYANVVLNQQPVLAAGTDVEGSRLVSPYWSLTGEWPLADGELLLGRDVAEVIAAEPGDRIVVEGQDASGADVAEEFIVSGLVQTGGAEDAMALMSLADLELLLDSAGELDLIEYSIASDEQSLGSLADRIGQAIPSATAEPVRRLAQSEASVLGTLRSLVYLVTAVVLALTLICVWTTMIAVVAERRREIGLRKALGAENRSIVLEFLGEGLLIGALGGIVGAGLGFAFAQLVSVNVFGRGITLVPSLAAVTVAVSIVVTGLACLAPVRRATEVDPATVLRGE